MWTLRNSPSTINITPCLSPHETLIDVLLARRQAALEDRSLLSVSWQDLQRQIVAEVEAEHKQRPGDVAADEASFQQVLAKMNEILPPQVENRTNEVSAAAELVVDDEGAIRWEKMFGLAVTANPFADLALAGGVSHRDELLEAVSPDDCLADPARYAEVLAEIGRGIHTATGLAIADSRTPGWIGMQCDSEEMAIWLVRAIIVENVMVRREEDVLYTPASPHYTLENEILSVVTVVAKTWRFWIDHITAQQWEKSEANDA